MHLKHSLAAMMLFAFLGPKASFGAVIYQNDFEAGVGPEWFNAHQTTTPETCTRCTTFLGEYGNEMVLLILEGLPPHSTVTLSFDLYAIRSWDGNIALYGGPDVFRVNSIGAGLNYRTTFSNNYPFGSQFSQAYPGSYPGSYYPSQFGAQETQTLGYLFDTNPIGILPMDAVYPLRFSWAHSDPSLAIVFWAENLSGRADESWGIDNVVVHAGNYPDPPAEIPEPAYTFATGAALLLALRAIGRVRH